MILRTLKRETRATTKPPKFDRKRTITMEKENPYSPKEEVTIEFEG